MNGTLTWKVGDGICAYYRDAEDTFGRSCALSVSSCRPDADSQLSAKCRAYSLLVSVADEVLYKMSTDSQTFFQIQLVLVKKVFMRT